MGWDHLLCTPQCRREPYIERSFDFVSDPEDPLEKPPPLLLEPRLPLLLPADLDGENDMRLLEPGDGDFAGDTDRGDGLRRGDGKGPQGAMFGSSIATSCEVKVCPNAANGLCLPMLLGPPPLVLAGRGIILPADSFKKSSSLGPKETRALPVRLSFGSDGLMKMG